jgi:hypothetical protein
VLVVRSELAMRLGVVTIALLVPSLAEARTPLPTIEVVQPQRRVRLLDLRWNVQLGGAIALGERAPLLALGQSMHVSFVELSKTWQLHAAFAETGLVDLSRGLSRLHDPPGLKGRRGLLGADAGLGISRHRAGGPALAFTVTAGPRWAGGAQPRQLRGPSWRIDGWGVMGQLDAYPFYRSMPEVIAGDIGWFRRYVLSGIAVWTAVRYDVLKNGARTPAFVAGGSIDFGRSLITPIVLALKRR